ncbi:MULTISPECIES: hypothetical protein [Pseudomonas]|uniref:Uncharacterized protein n=2 Tax=Pseudomonas fragariae (ex Marin et al. 2024) TaxID=3080056 RepID=A0ABT3LMD4_9PSED|nr:MULTISPECIES: hypothetical protein [Pseudomonas]MCW6057606.1 hypothetical protein [Pseudomonas fragi]MDV0427688.1 hypothetical protein [Pseudomonas sp. 17]MDX9573382.1 hypothetical protein [Pseudomonas sp. 21(2023)]MDX9587422.1 hypothetical protein [Pseudomonas sp. 19(2023)]MDX9625120.1 hypothetical protein [Pseudomonas sp. 20]
MITSEGGEDRSALSVMRDSVNAVIGWIPGPGNGLKKSLRIVNKDLQRSGTVRPAALRIARVRD